MASQLSSLISHLRQYQPFGLISRPSSLNFIIDYERFIQTLENIDEMIGLDFAKRRVANQIQSFIVNYRRFGKPTTANQLLHTMLYGSPGCGKTQLGQYLAELWACSGCLTSDKSQPLFNMQTQASSSTSGGSQYTWNQPDTEKVSLKQNLTIREAQIRQYQERIRNISSSVNNILTSLNNVRKKVQSKNSDHEQRIQSKFQQLKKNLRMLAGDDQPIRSSPSATGRKLSLSPLGKGTAPEILPVTVPKFSGMRSLFGNSNPPLLPQVPSQTQLVDMKAPVKFIRVTKGDLVGKYQGHTTDRVRQLLMQYDGGVVMIDEFYNLCTSSNDDFGKEALTEIINCMTTWPNRIIFIFAGYRKEIEDTVLKCQPGLARRINWTIDLADYSTIEICRIFEQQLKRYSLVLNENSQASAEKFFADNISKFEHFGGDTERLCTSVQETLNEENWTSALDEDMSKDDFNSLFTELNFKIVEKSFQKYLENSIKEREKKANEEEQKKKEEEQKKKDEESFSLVCHMFN